MRREEGDKNIDVQPNQQVEGTAGWEGEAAGMLSAEQCTPPGKTRTHILYTHSHTHTRHIKSVVIFPHDSVKNKTQVAATSGRGPRADARQPSLICTLRLSSGRMRSRPPRRPPLSRLFSRQPTATHLRLLVYPRDVCVPFPGPASQVAGGRAQGSSMNA